MRRKVPLVPGEIYHVFNKSIAKFKIFNNQKEFQRMLQVVRYYQCSDVRHSFSHLTQITDVHEQGMDEYLDNLSRERKKRVDILAYCFMPTHIHFILRPVEDFGVNDFMRLVQHSYSSYFNMKYKRGGPLWTGRFQAVSVKGNEQFLHITRYVHLNPVTAYLVEDPQSWEYSSCKEYLGLCEGRHLASGWPNLMDMSAVEYKKFMLDRKDYQRQLKKIQNLILE